MAIRGLDKEAFIQILKKKLSPSSPIQSHEDLHGRHVQLREIEQALSSIGRSVFIYGDRGVGKTSLGQTAAFEYKSSESDPIFKACSKNTTFFSVIESVASTIINNPLLQKTTVAKKGAVTVKGISFEAQKVIESGNVPKINDINSAVEIIKYLIESKEGNTIVVLDEFDLMDSSQEKELFAEFLKQIGLHDQ